MFLPNLVAVFAFSHSLFFSAADLARPKLDARKSESQSKSPSPSACPSAEWTGEKRRRKMQGGKTKQNLALSQTSLGDGWRGSDTKR